MTTIIPFHYFEAAFTGKSLNATNSGGDIKSARTICGKFIFNDDRRSVEDMKIKFFVKDIFGISHYIGSAKTDDEGKFHLQYVWKKGWFDHSHRIVLGIVEKQLPYKMHGLHFKQEITLESIEKRLPLDKMDNDLGTIPLEFADISKDLSNVNVPTSIHMQSPRYFWKLFKAILPEISKRILVVLCGKWLRIDQVQKIYDSFGPSYSKRAATPENLIDELLNHISAIDPKIEGERIVWTANWDGLEFDKDKSLPNVQVIADRIGKDRLQLDKIVIKFREDTEATEVTVNDKSIQWAIYIARSVFALKGEAEIHLAEGHILPGIPAKVFFKHIKPDNPLFAPLEPHLSQLDFINWFGSRGLIFGTGSVLDISALNDKSIFEVIIGAMKRNTDWLHYVPPEPIISTHYNAKAEGFHFNLLWSFFNDYIEKNSLEISKHWKAIYNWSEGICNLIESFPRITTNEYEPTQHDFKRLAKFLAWLVTKTTFVHWAAHSRQHLLTDIRMSSLGIENRGFDKDGNFDEYGNTLPKSGMLQLHTARTLMNFDGDSIFKDPNGDMNKELLALLRKHIAGYRGYEDIEKMHLTTQI